jgi:alkanesulfonate monooxygenase SsuD/methylene tetrahydromethanopterin reductase-like flavin-dependent oxidoreductase (luciferase family)
MLPNHAPLVIAEQFGTLESALSRPHRSRPRPRAGHRPAHHAGAAPHPMSADTFPQDVLELQAFLAPVQGPNQAIRAVPGAGSNVPLWILGSSLSARSSPPCSACLTPSPRISRLTR